MRVIGCFVDGEATYCDSAAARGAQHRIGQAVELGEQLRVAERRLRIAARRAGLGTQAATIPQLDLRMGPALGGKPPAVCRLFDQNHRSEEHTSELQSLMRNSYAVFCLKKKK